jgi:hypothetical protein
MNFVSSGRICAGRHKICWSDNKNRKKTFYFVSRNRILCREFCDVNFVSRILCRTTKFLCLVPTSFCTKSRFRVNRNLSFQTCIRRQPVASIFFTKTDHFQIGQNPIFLRTNRIECILAEQLFLNSWAFMQKWPFRKYKVKGDKENYTSVITLPITNSTKPDLSAKKDNFLTVSSTYSFWTGWPDELWKNCLKRRPTHF